MLDLSIIIISFNTKNITKKCLETIVQSLKADPSLKTEIIVVDNASSDGSVQMLQQVQSGLGRTKFKIIKNRQNSGFSKANNQAAAEAEGNYLLFLNSDIEVIDDAIPVLLNFFKNQNNFQFVGGKLFEMDGKTPQPSCGSFYSLTVTFGAIFLKGDYWGLTRFSPGKIQEVDWVSGACFITKKETFKKIGGFDENIFMYMDEIDLFFRAKKNKLKVGFYPNARFIHLGSASGSGRTAPILQVYKGLIYFYKKHHRGIRLKILKVMLELKAIASLLIGKLTGNQYLIETYGQAYKLAKDT